MVLEHFLTPLADSQLKLNWPVKRIEYPRNSVRATNSQRIKVTNTRGESIHADRVIVTVPLPILQVCCG